MKLPKFLQLADPSKTSRDCVLEALEEMHIGDNPRISDESYQVIKRSKSPETTAFNALHEEEFEKLFSRGTELLDYYVNGWHSKLAKRWILIGLGLCNIFLLIALCVMYGVLR